MRPLAMAAFFYQSFMWGSSYLFIKIGLAYWPPILMAATRNAVAAIFMATVLILLRRSMPATWRGWWPPLAFGVINGTSFALISWGQQYIPTGQTAILLTTMPLFTLLFARLILGERLTWLKALAVFLGIAGVVLAMGRSEGVGFAGDPLQRLLGQIAMLGAACFYSLSYIFGRRFFQADVYVNTTLHLFSSTLYVLCLSLLFDPPVTSAVFAWPAIGVILYLAIPGSAIAYLSIFYLMQNAGSLQTTYFSVINPIVALLLGLVVLGEQLTPQAMAGTVLVIGGVWLVIKQGAGEKAPAGEQ